MTAIGFVISAGVIEPCGCPFSKALQSRSQPQTCSRTSKHSLRIACTAESKDVPSVEIMPRQERRLWMAAVEGRRHVDIQSLARETGLDRRAVLDWLKTHDPKDIPQAYRLAPPQPAGEAMSANNASRQRDQPVSPVEEEEISVPGMKLKASDRATLERVYYVAQYPSDEMIQSILDITRMPRNKVLAWFQIKRSEDGMREKRKPYRPPFPKRK